MTRRALVTALVLALAGWADAAPYVRQVSAIVENNVAAATTVLSLPGVTTGSTIVVCGTWASAAVTATAADATNGAYASQKKHTWASGSDYTEAWAIANVTGGTLAPTITYSGAGGTFRRGAAVEVVGLTATIQLDGTPASASANSTTPASGTFTTTVDDSWLFSCIGNSGSAPAAGTGWTRLALGTSNDYAIEHRIGTPFGSYNGQWTQPVANASGTLAFGLKAGTAITAAPAFQAVSALANAISGDVTVTLPAHAADDVGLLLVLVRSNTETLTVSGWTAFTGSPWDRSTIERYWAFWRRFTSAAETNPLVDTDGTTANIYARVMTFRGATTSGDPWEVVGAVATGTADPATCTGITTLTANSLVVVPLGYADDNNAAVTFTGTDPAAYTASYAESATGDDGAVAFAYRSRVAAGATGDVSANFDVAVTAGDGWGCRVLALRPPGAAVAAPPSGLLLRGAGG